MSMQPLRNQLRILRLEIHRLPIPPQVVLHRIHNRHERLDDLLRLHLVRVVLEGPTDEEGAREVAHGVDDGLDVVAAAPVALVGGGVAEDEHEADDDGHGGDDGGWNAEVGGGVVVEGDDEEGEEGVDCYGDHDDFGELACSMLVIVG